MSAIETEIISTIPEQLAQLARLRSAEQAARLEMTRLREQVEESAPYRDASKRQLEARESIAVIETNLRALALVHFEKTGEKRVHDAVKVRVVERLVYNPAEATQWARENLEEALTLDARKFEQYAKGVMAVRPVPGVTVVREPQPTIASDLSPYIPAQEAIES